MIHVIDDNSGEEAVEIAAYIDAILIDSGNPSLAVKEPGGTGSTHNWDVSSKIREAIRIPLFPAVV